MQTRLSVISMPAAEAPVDMGSYGVPDNDEDLLWILEEMRNQKPLSQQEMQSDLPGKRAIELVLPVLKTGPEETMPQRIVAVNAILEKEKKQWTGPFTGPDKCLWYCNITTGEEKRDDVSALLGDQQKLVTMLSERYGVTRKRHGKGAMSVLSASMRIRHGDLSWLNKW